MKVRVIGTKPVPGTETFTVGIGNHIERWTIEQVRQAIENGLDVALADPTELLSKPKRKRER